MGVTATSCRTFLNSLGINTHAAQGYSTDYAAMINATGIANIRDALLPPGNPNYVDYAALNAACGAKLDALMPTSDSAALTASIAQAAALGSVLLAVEGPNEPNNQPIVYNGVYGGGASSGDTWVSVAQFQTDLYNGVAGAFPVFNVSETGAEPDNVGLQFITIPTGGGASFPDGTKFADFANCHNYANSNANTYGDNQAWNAADPTLNGPWDGLYGDCGVTWNFFYTGYNNTQLLTLPRVTTETGIDTTSAPWTEYVQGVVLVNAYLAQFARGWSYTFIYEMVDGEGSVGNQGIYHGAPGYAPKAAVGYIANLTTILADTLVNPSPGTLNLSISGAASTTHSLLLQKHSGTYELCVWGESAAQTPNSVTISLGQTFPAVNIYDVTLGSIPQTTYFNVSSVPLVLTDHAMIVELVGGGASASANSVMVLP